MEMVDEMVSTTSQAFLGLTVGCARCHDHKFDPIPTSDYYALGGIFGSTKLVGDFSEFWRDGRTRLLRPLAMPDEVAANQKVEQAIAEKKAQRWSELRQRHTELTAQWKRDESKYRAAAAGISKPFVKQLEAENFDGQDNLRIAQLMRDGTSVDVIETQTPTAQWVKAGVRRPDDRRLSPRRVLPTDESGRSPSGERKDHADALSNRPAAGSQPPVGHRRHVRAES
jgi:hypothetical protein